METPQTQQQPPWEINIAPKRSINRAGALLLGLIFIASAIFTASYLQGNARAIQTQKQVMLAATLAIPAHQPAPDAFASTTLQAHAAYVLDITNGQVLYNLNPDVQLPLASLTKVPMALVVSEVLTPDMKIVIPYDTAPVGNAERLTQGDTWRIDDIIDFTLAASSNDGAEILADKAGDALHARYAQSPADNATLWRMNDLAKQLGLTKTYFLNVSGLDESTTQSGAYGSAHDMATLFAYAATTSPKTFSATTRPSFTLTSVNGTRAVAINTDKVLDAIPGIIMGKTGYTDLAGGNLAVVFNAKPDHPVVAVVLGSTEQGRFDDMKKLVAAVQQTIR